MIKKSDIFKLIYRNSYKDFINFYNLSSDKFFNFLVTESPEKIEDLGQKMALKLFRKASKEVPSYNKFLKDKAFNTKNIITKKEFSSLPITTKKNYLKKYDLNDFCWSGSFQQMNLISVSSGSTGEPFFWPRGLGLEYETTLEYEIILKNFFKADKNKTLFIVGYAMGMYVAGVFTLNSLMNLIKKGYPLTAVTPGSDRDSILRIIKNIGKYFDQVIISAYPAVLKDVIDKGVKENLGWEKYNIKFISGGEGFSEEFRKYIYKRIGVKNYYKSSINTYGSADAAILGHETPLSIYIRKLVSENKELRKALFKDERLPSLLQYYPPFKYFEEIDGNLIFTTYGGIPLVRYSIGDTGGVISFNKMTETLKNFNINIIKEMTKNKCGDVITRLPFVYLFGRADNTKIFYGANIYPEHIKKCLEQKDIMHIVTGKYFIDILLDRNHNQTFYVAVELAHGIKINKKLKNKIANTIHHNLLKINREYEYLLRTVGHRIFPSVELFTYGDPKYFSSKIKPEYVKKE
ncbi:MAG: phenylacetate--CoA ligase family protein [Patescibacteria group bacterium]|nr:phenylacetate--CoA ligase family protein [Patescibacteria group bacterium]